MSKIGVFSRDEWEAEWAKTNPQTIGKTLSLPAYAQLCNKVGTERFQKWPGLRWDNARYVVHLEDVLSKGATVPAAYLRSVSVEDMRYDAPAFPRLLGLLHAIEGRETP